ncbi:Peptidoglycan/xylan/chitin deacetylase, PgdA/CDA1 family [Paenibacillus sp. yr247]|uniref:polysaccharide deacetylase n=1 Tax=Paenibacillus sp. yr247 TaxID=1761880 RepID=UPI00087E9682|nr:polysaccharide deacetylase [Paenibacillus sp. yr247]SDO66126.1 Peptidoglycan/xylan/chitin deacetylase, PgdA/CDA1 family [Paenibacillus sp. yr247]
MLFQEHHATNKQKRIQLSMVVLLLVSLFFSAIPVKAAEGDGYSAQEGQDLYQKLKTGKRLQGEKTYEAPEQPTVYLTFDDGPSKLTGQVLDILEKEDVKATFFALGEQSQAHPELVKRIVQDGHTLGNHSYNHVYKELYSDFQTFWDQIQRSEDVFAGIADVRPQLVRAPGGTYTNFDAYYYYLMDQAGYTVVDWNVDSGDSKRSRVPVNEIWQTIKESPLEHEINILFHDGSGHESTVEVLPQVIAYYKKLGYAFAPLTTQVKPKQFPVGKSKWSRNMSLVHFQELLKETQLYASAHPLMPDNNPNDAINLLVHQTKVATEETAQILSKQSTVPLQVHVVDGSSFTLEPTEYQLRANRIELPLRFLIEKLGGKVEWQENRKTANAHYGVYDVEYDLSARSIRLYSLGNSVATYSLADMNLQNGKIIVPLRKTIDLIGGRITNSVIEPDKREVSMAFRQFYMFRENNSLLKNSLFALGG